MATATKAKADFTRGKLFIPILLFSLPIMATGILQLLYSMADQVVVGRFSGDGNALAAIGSTSSLTHLIVNFLVGISTGTGVLVAQLFGAKQSERIEPAVHTSIAFAFLGGIAVGVFGILAAEPILAAMDTKPEILAQATLYIQITFAGLPGLAVYNFGAAAVRAMGNSRTPLIILSLSGLANVALNLVFVIVFHMGVAGVAVATIVAQYISAVAVLAVLAKTDGPHRFYFKKLRIELASLRRVLRVGVPSALQGCLFSFSNVLIQSATNTFPTTTVAAFSLGNTVEGFTYIAMNSFHHAALTVVGQNYGAGDRRRIRLTLLYSVLQVTVVGLLVAGIEILFARPIATLFVDNALAEAPLILDAAVERMRLMLATYVLCGIMDVLSGYLRGVGYSLIPMFTCIFGVCAIRVLWVLFVFPIFSTPIGLLVCYPVSWGMTILLHAVNCVFAAKKLKKETAS